MPSAAVLDDFPAAAHPAVDGYDRYPEFCEERVEASSPDYEDCQRLTGHAVIDDGVWCRAFHPIRCVAGLHQHGAQICRAVQRRSWSCDDGFFPGNRFLVCYQPTTHPEGVTVAACGTGAPDFGVFADTGGACETYVGEDVISSANERDCSDYRFEEPFPRRFRLRKRQITLNDAANDYWCRFDRSWLNTGCHNRGPRCERQMSLCLMRASRTGGCDQIIDTIRCRGYQNALQHNRVEISEVRQAGCTPCVTLPFEPPTCEGDDTALPSDRDDSLYWAQRAILRCGFDFSSRDPPGLAGSLDPLNGRTVTRCPDESRPPTLCADPPSGAVEWSSNHLSQLAVVNSAVILRIVDLPAFVVENITYPNYLPSKAELGTIGGSFVRYRDSDQLDSIPRHFPNVDPARSYGNLFEMATAECVPYEQPLFNIMIEELWPDLPAARDAIVELFGAESLEWWDNLTDDGRQSRTEARGLTWQTDDGRDAALRSVVECHERTLSCVWHPQHPGYYRIVGAGGWKMRVSGTNRRWGASHYDSSRSPQFASYEAALNMFLSTQDLDQLTQRLNRSTVKRDLDRMGSNGDGMFSYADMLDVVGIEMRNGSLRLRDPYPGDGPDSFEQANWLYSEHARGLTGCPFRIDLRVDCSGEGLGGNYTETTPIGIIVHEVRTQTVATVQNR